MNPTCIIRHGRTTVKHKHRQMRGARAHTWDMPAHTQAHARFSFLHSNNSKRAFIFIGHANSSEPACRKRSMGRNEKQEPLWGEKYQTPAALMHL